VAMIVAAVAIRSRCGLEAQTVQPSSSAWKRGVRSEGIALLSVGALLYSGIRGLRFRSRTARRSSGTISELIAPP
jgi:hypothetical protein